MHKLTVGPHQLGHRTQRRTIQLSVHPRGTQLLCSDQPLEQALRQGLGVAQFNTTVGR